MSDISIVFDRKELSVIISAIAEYSGGSFKAMERISGLSDELMQDIEKKIEQFHEQAGKQPDCTVTLAKQEWKMVYDSINAMIYALGPFELELLWRNTPFDVLETNQKICTAVWGAYGGQKWTDKYESKIKG